MGRGLPSGGVAGIAFVTRRLCLTRTTPTLSCTAWTSCDNCKLKRLTNGNGLWSWRKSQLGTIFLSVNSAKIKMNTCTSVVMKRLNLITFRKKSWTWTCPPHSGQNHWGWTWASASALPTATTTQAAGYFQLANWTSTHPASEPGTLHLLVTFHGRKIWWRWCVRIITYPGIIGPVWNRFYLITIKITCLHLANRQEAQQQRPLLGQCKPE